MSKLLIHIGYPKAGSTYLQTWFSNHPGMYYQQFAINGFHHTDDISRYAEKETEIHECFVISSEHLSVWSGTADTKALTASSPYDLKLYRTKLCRTLHEIYPNAKILIVTRGYLSLFPSFYSQYLTDGGIHDFEFIKDTVGKYFPDLYDYTEIVKLYQTTFGNENIIVLPYELLLENAGKFLALIEERLEMKQHFSFTNEKINRSLDSQTLYAYRTVSSALYRVLSMFPDFIRNKLFGSYLSWLNRKRPHNLFTSLGKRLGKSEEMKGLEDVLSLLKGKAEVFREEKLYEPYLKDYLL